MQPGIKGKTKEAEEGGRRGSTFPRDGLEVTLFCSHCTECLRYAFLHHIYIKYLHVLHRGFM